MKTFEWTALAAAAAALSCATMTATPPRSFLTLGMVQSASELLQCDVEEVTVFDTGDRLWARGCGRETIAGTLEEKADDRERTELRRSLWPANDLYGPFGIKDEQKTHARFANGAAIPVTEEAQPISEQKFPVRMRCVLRTDGTLHQCYVSARTADVAEAAGKIIPSQRFKPAVAHGHPVASIFQFNASITRPAQP